MKALLIKPTDQTIESIDINSQQDIIDLIGYDTVIADEIDDQGDKLYFDEECFLRGTEGRFQLDKLIPVSGNGIIIGSNDDDSLSDLKSDPDDIKSRIKFL